MTKAFPLAEARQLPLWRGPIALLFLPVTGMAGASLLLALMIPRHPEAGNETVFSRIVPAPAE